MRLREATRELKATQKLLKDKDAALQAKDLALAEKEKALKSAEAERTQLLALLSQHGIQLPPQQGNPN
jgi:hypothetical protein